jgi:hypothetical protein
MGLRHPGPAARAAVTLAEWVVVIALSPVILLAGEFVNRYVMRRLRSRLPVREVIVDRTGDRSPLMVTSVRLTGASSLMLIPIRNPLWIALTAPGRWVADQFTVLKGKRAAGGDRA